MTAWNNRRKREYRRETYEVDHLRHCVRRRASKTKSCHVGRHQRHRPGLAIPLVVVRSAVSRGMRGAFLVGFSPTLPADGPRVCAIPAIGVGASSTRLRVGGRYRHTRYARPTHTSARVISRSLSPLPRGRIEGKKASFGLDRS